MPDVWLVCAVLGVLIAAIWTDLHRRDQEVPSRGRRPAAEHPAPLLYDLSFARGLVVAAALSAPIWAALVWAALHLT